MLGWHTGTVAGSTTSARSPGGKTRTKADVVEPESQAAGVTLNVAVATSPADSRTVGAEALTRLAGRPIWVRRASSSETPG